MRLYRMAKKHYARDLSGEGARLYGGRWNHIGYRVVYTSESIPLAVLEYITKISALKSALQDMQIVCIETGSSPGLKVIEPADLPSNWNTYPAPETLKQIGTDWLLSQETLLLKVPAVSAPESYNILLNPQHQEFKDVKIIKTIDYEVDKRLNALQYSISNKQ